MKKQLAATVLLVTISSFFLQCTEEKTLYSEDKENNFVIQQTDASEKSPLMILTGKIDGVDVIIRYGSPSVKEREIWGKLVPFGEVWRTGANQATSIEFKKNVVVAGNDLKAGRYGLFTIPKSENEWTFILNRVWDQWGAFDYDAEDDVVRFDGKATKLDESEERLNFLLNQATNTIAFQWDKLQVGFVCKDPNNKDKETTENVGVSAQTEDGGEVYKKDEDNNFVIYQDNADKPSPLMTLKGELDGVNVIIKYGSPSVKGREIWGNLVPYGQVWRTGANQATSIEFDKDVMIAGKQVAAGKYGLFTIPNKQSDWTFIINGVWDQWGAYEYDKNKDIIRVNATPKTLEETQERLTFMVDQSSSAIAFQWDKLQVGFTCEAAE